MDESQKVTQRTEDIVRLNPMEHVRIRPGMYIGGTNQRAMHHLIYGVVDHSIELAFTGQCDHIWINLRNNNEVRIRDNGPEIPFKIDKRMGLPLLQAFMTEYGVSNERMHGFPEKSYRGMHSMAFYATNALCEDLSIESTYDGICGSKTIKKGFHK